LIEAGETRARPIGGDDIDPSIAIQIGDCCVARGPFSHTPCAGDREAAFAIVQVDELPVRRVVAREHIEVTVAIEIRQRRRVGSIRRRAQVRRHKAAFPVVDQHAIEERRVPSLRRTTSRSPSPSRSPKLTFAESSDVVSD
jgi:hypothetical protein